MYWYGNHATSRILDLTKIIQENPDAPVYGNPGEFHWWGDSEDGYYKADDPWVIRRQLEMFSVAGVDFLYIDVTGGFNYLSTVDVRYFFMTRYSWHNSDTRNNPSHWQKLTNMRSGLTPVREGISLNILIGHWKPIPK